MMNPVRKRVSFGVALLPLSSLLLFTGCSSSLSTRSHWPQSSWTRAPRGTGRSEPSRRPLQDSSQRHRSLPASSPSTERTLSGHLRTVALAGMIPCVPSSSVIDIAGTVDAQRKVSFASTNLPGGTLSVSGTLAEDGKSLMSPSYSVAGGTCGFSQPATVAGDFCKSRCAVHSANGQLFGQCHHWRSG